jgi:hypothetical protein
MVGLLNDHESSNIFNRYGGEGGGGGRGRRKERCD